MFCGSLLTVPVVLIQLKMKFALIFSVFLPTAFSQGSTNEWGCNHYSAFPTDFCYTSSSTFSFKYTCDGTDTIVYESYSVGECSGDPSSTLDLSLSDSTNGDIAECDNIESCGYYEMTCDDKTELILTVGVCYSYSSSSVYYTCLGSIVGFEQFSDSTDCTGSSSFFTFDYDNSVYEGCEVK